MKTAEECKDCKWKDKLESVHPCIHCKFNPIMKNIQWNFYEKNKRKG